MTRRRDVERDPERIGLLDRVWLAVRATAASVLGASTRPRSGRRAR